MEEVRRKMIDDGSVQLDEKNNLTLAPSLQERE